MRRCILVALLLIFAAAPGFALTVSEVVEMTQAGLGDEVIINQIRATHSRFDLTVDEIIELSDAGVSDAVLSTMIATAFDVDATYGATEEPYETEESYDYDDNDVNRRYVVIEDEPEVHTFIHLGLGYYSYPWSYVWWDYWSPPWDYYWYAGDFCQPWWYWHYRPWYYGSWRRHPLDWCATYPGWGCGWGWDRGDRVCHVRSGTSRVRWKSNTHPLPVTLAGSKTRMKAIQDADRGRTKSALARLEPTRSKSSGYRSSILSKGVSGSKVRKQLANAPPSGSNLSRTAVVRSLRAKTSRADPAGSQSWNSRKRATGSSGTTISKSRQTRSGNSSSSSVGSSKKTWGSNRTSGSKKSSGSSSAASRPSVQSHSGSKSSSPARSSGGSGSKSRGSSGSRGSKTRR